MTYPKILLQLFLRPPILQKGYRSGSIASYGVAPDQWGHGSEGKPQHMQARLRFRTLCRLRWNGFGIENQELEGSGP